jgi:hypothetical protein
VVIHIWVEAAVVLVVLEIREEVLVTGQLGIVQKVLLV